MTLTVRLYLQIIPLCGVLGGCGSSDDLMARHRFEVSVEDEVIVARSSAIPKYEGELFTYERALVLKEDEREESLFVRGDAPYIDERGYFYMTDNSPSDYPSTSCIMVYDSEGTFLFSFGKPGQGPGDMIHPEILRVDNGTIETYDPYQRRFSIYTTDGKLSRIISVPAWKGVGWIRTCYHASNGYFIVPDRMAIPGANERNLRQSAVTVFSTEWDTLCTILGEPVPGNRTITAGEGQIWLIGSAVMPFGPSPVAVYNDQHGVLLTSGKEPVIDSYSLEGIHTMRIQIDLPPKPVTDEDRRKHEAPIKKQLAESRPEFKAFYKAELDALEYPEYMRFWSGLEVDYAGFIWIQIPEYVTALEYGEDAVLYYVLSPEGEYLGITRLPTYRRGRTRLTKGFLTVVEMDQETGEKEIVAYRIGSAVSDLIYP